MAFSYKDWHNKKVASEVESWLNDYENFYNETATAYKNRAGQFQNAEELRKNQQSTFDRINSLTSGAKKYRDYINANRDRFNSDSVDSVLGVLNGAIEGENSLDYLKKALDDEIVQWGNFSSEDEYNEQKRQIDLRENFDVASAMARAKELRQQLPQYMTSDELHSKYGGAQGATNAYMNRNPEAEKEYEQLLKDIEDYGKIQDSKNAIEETKRFANFDFDENEKEIEKWKTALKSAEKNLNKANSTFSWGQNQWETNKEKQEYIDMYNGDIDKAKDMIHSLEQDRKNATKYRNSIYYDSLMGAEDFKDLSFKISDELTTDMKYNYINDIPVNDTQGFRRSADEAYKNGAGFDYSSYAYMSPNEKNIYNYTHNKFGEEKANEYLDTIDDTLRQRQGTAKAKEILETESKILRGLKIGKQAIDTGLDQAGTGIGQLFSSDAVDTTATQYAASIIDEEVDNPLGKVVYRGLTSVANMAPSIVLSAATGSPLAGALLMGGTASGNAYKRALDEGMRKDKARGYSRLVGASEALLQYLLGGVGKLGGAKSLTNIGRKAISNIDNVLLRVGADIGISALGEGVEEGLQEVLDPIFRNMVFDENNEVKLFSKDVMYSAIVGAVVGTFMEGMSIAKTDIKFNNVGKSINVTNKTEELINNALNLDAETDAHKLALEMKEGEVKPNDVNVGELYVNFAKDGGDTSFVLEGQEQVKPDWLVEDEDDGFLDFERGAYTGNNTTNNAETRLSSELSELVDDFGELGIEAFDEFYTEGVDKPQYYAAFASYYNAGRNGTDISKVKSSYKDLLPQFQKEGAYYAGQLDAKRNGSVSGKVAQNGITAESNVSTVSENKLVRLKKEGIATLDNDVAGFIDNVNGRSFSLTEKGMLDKLARALRVKIVVNDDVTTDNGTVAEGGYGNSIIRISKDSENPMLDVVKHEVSHRIKELSPKQFAKFEKYAMKYGKSIGKTDKVNWDVSEIQSIYSDAGQNLSPNEAVEEIVSDFAELELMLNEAFINDVAQNEPDLAKTILNWIKDIIATVKEALGISEPTLERAQRLWENAIRSAVKEADKIEKNPEKQKNNRQNDGNNGIIENERYSIGDILQNGSDILWNKGKSLYLPNEEYATVYSRISTEYYRTEKHGGIQFVDRTTDWDHYVYLYKDYDFGSYEIIARLDYSKHEDLIEFLRGENLDDRTTKNIIESVKEERFIDTFFNSDWDDSEIGQRYFRNEKKNNEITRREREISNRGRDRRNISGDDGRSNNLINNKTSSGDVKFSIKKATTEETKENANKALAYFGKTFYWNETGYLTADGKKIDFSGKKFGSRGGRRTIDHREIGDAMDEDYGDGSYSGALIQFMSEGNVRIMPESNGINLSVMPTKAQEEALSDYISRARGEVIVDIDDLNGNTVVSQDYPKGTRAEKVLSDIREYFKNGTVPYVSELSKYRYSIKTPSKKSLKEDLSDIDAEYLELAKNPEKNEARLRELVDEAARKNGYTRKMFHETDAENIHVFNISLGTHGGTDSETPYGIFTKSTDKNIGLGNKQMSLYVKANNTLYVENRGEVKEKIPELIPYYDEISRIDKKYDALLRELEDAEFDALSEWMEENPDADMDVVYPTQYIIDGKPANIDSQKYLDAFSEGKRINEEWKKAYNEVAVKCKEVITSYLRNNEYDSMYFKVDGGSRGRETDSLILLDPEQVKSADIVTYDDEGNIIPPSKRFNQNNPDYRYSIKNSTKKSYEEKIAYLKGEFKLTHGTQLLKKDADRIVRGIAKAYSSKVDKGSLSTKLQEIFALCKRGKFEEGHLKAEELAKEIIDNAVTLSSQYGEEYSGVRQYFKDTEIIVSNKIRNDITDFESFRKRNMGKLRIKYGHGNVDTVYQELNSMYPDLFPDDVINASDQLQKMAEVAEMLKPTEINPYEGQTEEAVNAVYEDIVEAVSNTEAHQTFADKKLEEKKQAVQEERDKHSEEIKKLKEYYKKDNLKNITLPDGRSLGELTLAEIYNLKDEDMSTTPKLEPLPDTGIDETIGKESKFYGSAMKSENVADETKKLIENVNDIKYYVGITNLETLEAANDKLNKGGSAETLRFINMDKKNATAEDVAEGFILLKRYQDAGDFEGAVVVAQKLREIGTSAGQTVQAFSILNRLTPEGMAVYAQKELDKALEEMKQRHSDKWIEKHKEMFELTPEEMEFIKNNMEMASRLPDGRDKTVLVAEIASMIQAKMPTKLRNQIKAYTRISMLLNTKTMLRNVVGNAIMFPEFIIQDFIGAGIDAIASKKTGTRTKGTGFNLEAVKSAKKGVIESYDDFRRNINTRGVDNDRFEIGSGPAFKSYSKEENLKNPLHALSTALNRLDRVTSWLLDAGDRPFFEYHFTNELNNLMKANKVTEYNAEMVEMATNLALERTWQDNNKYTELVTKLVRILNLGNEWGFGSIVIPFAKTPANLVKALVDYSPAGLIYSIASDARKFRASVKNGKPDIKLQRKFVDSFSKGITGTLFMVIAGALASNGILSGGDDEEDKDMKAFKQNILGIAPYSVTVDGRSYTYDWAQPVGGQMAIASDFVQFMNSDKKVRGLKVGAEGAGKAILNALASGGNVLFEQSFLQGMSYLFSEDDFVSGIIRTGTNAVTQFFPTALSQVAQMADPVVRTSYENGDFGKTAWNKVKGKIPFARNTLAPAVDVLGNEVQSYGGRNHIGNIFLNPSNVYSKTASEVAEEIYRVYEETGELSVIPRVAPYYIRYDDVKYDFTSHEKADYQKKMGKTTEVIVNDLISSSAYKGLADEEKAKVLTATTNYSNALAKYEYLKTQGKEYERDSWMIKAEEGKKYGLSIADYITAYTITRDVESIKDKNGETIDNSKSLQIMEKVYSIKGLSDKERKYLFEALGVGKKVRHYSKALVESKLNRMR